MARIMYLPVTAEFILNLARTPNPVTVRCIGPYIPDDAKILRMGHDTFGQINIILESASYPDVQEGDPIPLCPTPRFEKVYR